RPDDLRARPRPRARARLDDPPDARVGLRQRLARTARRDRPLARGGDMTRLRAVLFDVDFTLAKPGPELGPEGYRGRGEDFGLELDPARYEEARAAAVAALERHPELMHDEEIWIEFTERIVRGMGGEGDLAHDCAVAIERAWEEHANFDLYEDAVPVLDELRRAGLKLGLVSNGAR